MSNKNVLKSELHIHTNFDPNHKNLNYNNLQLIDKMYSKGYDVIAITCHDRYFDDLNAIQYAKEKGITLIPGIEKTINKQHVLIYNAPKEKVEKIKSLKELKKLKKEHNNILIIAPHPFFFHKSCLKNNIIKYEKLFDAYEISFFYLKFLDLNKKTIKIAKKYKKTLVGNCDIHNINFNFNIHTNIYSKNNKDDIIQAIKKGNTKVIRKPLKIKNFFGIFFSVAFNKFKRSIYN